jgi:hypothetical protein
LSADIVAICVNRATGTMRPRPAAIHEAIGIRLTAYRCQTGLYAAISRRSSIVRSTQALQQLIEPAAIDVDQAIPLMSQPTLRDADRTFGGTGTVRVCNLRYWPWPGIFANNAAVTLRNGMTGKAIDG